MTPLMHGGGVLHVLCREEYPLALHLVLPQGQLDRSGWYHWGVNLSPGQGCPDVQRVHVQRGCNQPGQYIACLRWQDQQSNTEPPVTHEQRVL